MRVTSEGARSTVYRTLPCPQLTNASPSNDLLPVLVFIYGGGFIGGFSNSTTFGPDYFMDKGEVILVTFNYRVGPFGTCGLLPFEESNI